jgi:hypothetical protein
MSHHFIVPANENGVSLDATIASDIGLAMNKPFDFQDVFLFSHGWWTNATQAMQGYNRFTIEFSSLIRSTPGLANLPVLSIGVHWPSTLSEDQLSLLNYAEALSFFTMEKRADTVGDNCAYALLKLVLNAYTEGPLRIHLVGHSFGCKVVCSALQQLAVASAAEPIPDGVSLDVALMQAAFDNDELEPTSDYGSVAGIPGLRMLITHSDGDTALSSLYPTAHRLVHLFHSVQPALGNAGPTQGVVDAFNGVRNIDVGPDFVVDSQQPLTDRLVVANLTSLHEAHPESSTRFSGHHTDVFRAEVYRLLASFFLSARA